MYNKKEAKYYFLDEVTCKFIVNFIMALVVANLLFALENYLPFSQRLDELLDSIVRWLGIFGTGAYTAIHYIKDIKDKISNNDEDREENYNEWEPKIERKNQVNRLLKMVKMNKIVILTGMSGAGKTEILHQMKDAYYKNNDYFLEWGESACNQQKRIVILDQFERALTMSNLYNNLNCLIKSKKHIIVSVKKEHLGDVLLLFNFNRHIPIFYLNYDEEDKKEIEIMCEKIVGKNINELENKLFYRKLKHQINNNKIPIIMVSAVWKIICKENMKNVTRIWKDNDYSFEKMVSNYLEKEIIGSLTYKEIAYPILYMLSRDRWSEYRSCINDFKNITFADNKKIIKTVEELIKAGLIKEVVQQTYGRNPQSVEYEMAHEFYAKKLIVLCTEHITTEVRGNIEDYQENCQKKRKDIEGMEDIFCYNNVHNRRRKNQADRMLMCLCIIIFIENCICWLLPISIEIPIAGRELEVFTTNNFMIIFLDIVVGLSIYYIYNYYYRFLIVFGKKYMIVNIVGGIVSALVFIFVQQWAFFLGIEITFLGINMYRISKQVRKSEQHFFVKRVQTFCAIGIITMLLGIFFSSYTKGNVFLMIPLFILYSGYMLMGNLGHINKNYILMILGKARKEEIHGKD